jgi:hypothetical protein
MTPALKAMVEAMGREFLRQTEESDEAPVCQFEAQALRVTDVYGGSFDLEKVARAGLEAIKVLPDATLDAAKWKTDLFPAQIDQAMQAAVHSILEEKP